MIRRALVSAAVAGLLVVPTLSADTISMQAWLVLNGTFLQASGFANAYTDDGRRLKIGMSGNLTLFSEATGVVDYDPWMVWNGSWSDVINESGWYRDCFAATVIAQTGMSSGRADSGWGCTGDPPAPPPDGNNGGSDILLAKCQADSNGCAEPLLINLEHGPYRLTGIDDSVTFDIFARGHTDTISWTKSGAEIAFLAIDLNANGMIDDGSELFGNASLLPNGHRAPNGFRALGYYDLDGNGVIDARDPVWPKLLLWIDRNHDGISQPTELQPVSGSAITSISTEYHWTGRHDASGNAFGYEGHLNTGREVHSFYDVFFVVQ